jgi:hypothetical protein
MYYSSTAASSTSNGTTTFPFFDDGGDQFPLELAYEATRNAGSTIGFKGKCPRVVIANNGTWLMTTRLGASGAWPTGHDGQVWITRSYNAGVTWTDHEKLSNDIYDAVNAEFIKYPNGEIEIFYTRYDDGAAHPYVGGVYASRSTDNGTTWSNFVNVTDNIDGNTFVMWQDITIGNTVYVSVDSSYCTGGEWVYIDELFYKTEDNGTTWTKVGEIHNHTVGTTYYEPGIVYLSNGEFVAVLRDGGKAHTLQKRSTDWGATWSIDGYIKS